MQRKQARSGRGSAALALPALAQTDPLPSWNDGAAKQAILGFVARVTREDGPDFVPSAERIAVFDNDGTLWAEQPTYSRSSSRSTASRMSATPPGAKGAASAR